MSFINHIPAYLIGAGTALTNLDLNQSGADDFAGALLMYAGYAIDTVVKGGDIPPLPEVIRKGTTEKITGASRSILTIASAVLVIAQFEVGGRAATVLKYVYQSVQALLDNQPVPPIGA